MNNEWMAEVRRAVPVFEAARILGLRAGRQLSVGPCPLCKAEKRGAADPRLPIGCKADKWHCWVCNEGGDLLDLVSALRSGRTSRGLDTEAWSALRADCAARGWCEPFGRASSPAPARRGARSGAPIVSARQVIGKPEPEPQEPESQEPAGPPGRFAFSEAALISAERQLWEPEGAEVLAYLRDVRKFSEDTIRAWRLGAYIVADARDVVRELWVVIPLLDHREEPVNLRFRSVPGGCRYCEASEAGCSHCDRGRVRKQFRVSPGRPLPLYGAHRLSDDLASTPIIVEGELDVVALYELGWRTNVVSGTGGAKTLKEEWLDQLEPYSGFVIAYDDDKAGDEGAEPLIEKLGRYRCSRARFAHKDAGECLASGIPAEQIERAIENSEPCVGVSLRKANSYAAELERLIANPAALVGRPTGSARLDRALGGIRSGLIVITGETGSGKTSFTSWLFDQQARAGVPSLVTSFEQRPMGTIQKLLRMEVGGDFLPLTPKIREDALDAIADRPLWIVDHHGHLSWDKLKDTIQHAIRRKGVRNVMIDHLGFVVDPDCEDERRETQKIVRALSLLAEHEDVAIFLICHPSNTYVVQQRRVGIGDLKGASAIRQDMHEGWVIEQSPATTKRPWYGTWVHLDKIRSDFGASGSSVLLAFDPLAICYGDAWELTPSGKRGVRVVVPEAPAREPGPGRPRGRRERKPREAKGKQDEHPAEGAPPDEDGVDPTTGV